MRKKMGKRLLTVFLAVTLIISTLPVQAFVSEIDFDNIVDFDNIESNEGYEDNLLWQTLIEMNAILVRYLGSNTMTEDEIIDAVICMDWDTIEAAVYDIEKLEPMLDDLTDDEQEEIFATRTAELLGIFHSTLELAMTPAFMASVNSTNTVLGGKITVSDSQGTGTVSNNVVTITVKGSLASGKSNTIDIYNNTNAISTLTFNYKASDYDSFSESNSSGTCSVLLNPGENVTLTIKSKAFYGTATLVLSNFSLVEAQASSAVTFDYESALGSVAVNGFSVASGSSTEITLADGATLVAKPASGAQFLGWIDASNSRILSTSTSYFITPVADMTIKPAFIGKSSKAYFTAGNELYLFDDLNKAATYAASTNNKTVILMNDGTLAAGNYTIPAGVTLLIPFDSANTIYTTTPEVVSDTHTTPTAYRTLTMASGANITVNGVICLPAKHYAAKGNKENGGSTDGPCGFIKMENNTNITVNNGGVIYAYGFITGSGNVVAKNGAAIFEYFQIMDFRGGNQTTDMENGVFPLSQYYVQNIEVPLTLEAGSTESSYTSMYISSMTFGSSITFIAKSDAMFKLTSGSVTKRYDTATDRLIIEVDGEMSISPIEMKIGSGLLATTIDTSDYVLPINNNITVKVNSGSVNISQDLALLPGSEIIIGENAKCTVASETSVFVYDSAEWGNYCGASNKTFIPVQYAPGRTYIRKASDIKDAVIYVEGTLDASKGYLYTTSGGANIYSIGSGEVLIKKGSKTVTYQLVQNSGYVEIPITTAKLKNADGSYVSTTAASATYYYINGTWVNHSSHIYSETVIAADCVNVGSKTYTCPCGSTYVETIPALGHSAGAAATCMTAQVCLSCGAEISAATGHSYQTVITAPTCTKGGYTTHTCSSCGDTYTDNKVSALGHTAGAAATCTTAQSCTVCGIELVPAIGHDYKSTVTAPTCTEDGYTAYTCSHCGDRYVQDILTASGHTPGEDATCTKPQTCTICGETLKSENGHTPGAKATCIETQTCTVCGDELAPALGHDMIYIDSQEATCTEDGYSSGSHCSRCDYIEGKAVIPARGHTPGMGATCTKNQICTVCGEELVSALGHNYTETVVLPTCTRSGYTIHSCVNCGDSYTDTEVAAMGHAPGKAATCTEPQRCVDCAAVLSPAKGHTHGAAATCTDAQLCTDCNEIVTPATGHTPGAKATCKKAQVCSICNEELVGVLEHKFTTKTIEATCTEIGNTVHICSRCRYEYIDNEVAATGHSMADATCTEPSKCLNDGCDYTEGSALGHTEVEDEGMPAFCTQDGITEGSHCSVCNTVIIEQKVIPALEHNIEQHAAKKPTYTSVGWEAYEDCTRCSYSTYVEIPMLSAPVISDYASFLENLALLEELAYTYALEVPGKDPVDLVLKYIRTGVEKYNEGSWGIMAGYEDSGFAEFVDHIEDEYNAIDGIDSFIIVSSLKNLEQFELPNGDMVDFGHMFGAMDITYHNKTSQNHADVAGWSGDLVDLLEFSDYGGVTGSLEEMVSEISANYLLKEDPEDLGGFNQQDMYGDLDAFYLMQVLIASTYEEGLLTELFTAYFTETLTMEIRADYYLENRLDGVSTRSDVRDAVFNAYTGNKLITTLEATRDFQTEDLSLLRKACCYAFADYICRLAGDFVDVTDNPYYTVFSSKSSTLAPGIVQSIKYATSADGKQMVYYTATADITRDDVNVYANYKDNEPSVWGMQTVLAQANAAQNKYGDPESEYYIENYNVIASINGDGYDMATGEPGGLLVMNGEEYHAIDGGGFFGILEDGTAVIGTQAEYNSIYKDRVKEGIGGFGSTLVKDGEICITATTNYYTNRASRTAIGITKTGKVVFMVLDGRQEPVSCGGSMEEIAQIMLEAGCVNAINLDGGGSTTYVAKIEGADELSVVSSPSDGTARSVSTSLIMVSTAHSSTAFDHAVIESETDYLTKHSSVQLIASGVSATGNSAELPEEAYWVVSDENYGTITADGVFTGLKNGSVDVYLMVADEIIGAKTMNIVIPDRVYFTKTNIDAVYGEQVELPVKALYENKSVTITESDVVFTLSNTEAGAINGFFFVGTEGSKIKNLTVTVSLAADEEKTASITVSLYNQGEVSFDFDQATGGDRTLAWYREVSNSTTDDNVLYEIENPDESMVTSYVFAIDMTQIPIPEQLADLTSMLPGAELEGASAWTFLLQLAERISVLSEVKPVVYIDKNFDVDYSELTVINEYFNLTNVEFNEEENSLTLTLNWIDQTQAIDSATANPLCIVSGLKITPKEDAVWTKDRLNVVNSGGISYNIYMRANALYTFSQKAENQENYCIYPFVNPGDENEKGGYFGDVYAWFEDSYTLSTAIKDGWVSENGGFAYYADGVRYTGVQFIDGYYYDFGENGINVGQTVYTGVFYDETDDVYRYSKLGVLDSGWQMIGTDWYYFHSSTMAAQEGAYKVGAVSYEFEKTGKLVSGVWVKCILGYRYYYGPSFYKTGWTEIDGNKYYFQNSYRYEGFRCVQESNSKDFTWYDFGTDGICKSETIPDGFYTDADGTLSYVVDGLAQKGLHKIDGDYYFFDYYGHAVVGQKYVDTTCCDLPTGVYRFGDDYKALNGIVEIDGVLYYYVNGKPKSVGLIEIDGDYYFAGGSNGEIIVGMSKYVWEGNDLLPEATYEFGAEGKMLDGIVEKDGVLYYYEAGKPKQAGLILIDGGYYFAGGANGELSVNKKQYVWQSNGLLPADDYEFGADGRMLDGIVEKDGALYYYETGTPKQAGLLLIDGDYYFAAGTNGEIIVNEQQFVWKANDLLPESTYEFGTDGKMLDGIVEKDGVLYYYETGKPKQAGLLFIDGYYYFAGGSNGELAVSKVQHAWETNGLLTEADYEYGADGRMLDGIVEKDGVLYYYETGKPKQAGLILIDGCYYFASGSNGEITVNSSKYVWNTNGLLSASTYEFGADGRMLDGIVEKDGVLYYYETGKPKQAGLILIDGDYYFAGGSNGELSVSKTQYVWQSNGLLSEDDYEFGADGKMINGFFEKDGVLYYYVDGRPAPVGLNYVDGHYYFVKYDGSLIVNQSYYAWETNGYSVEMTYTFNELGQVVA